MTFFPFFDLDCSCNKVINDNVCCGNCGRCQCRNKEDCIFLPGIRTITQKRIQNQVRVPESLYINSLSAVTISGGRNNLPLKNPSLGFFGVNQSQASDRNKLHIQTRFVPTGGDSTRTSITRNRPGSMGPAGKNAVGVDVKNNSYARYLGRLKSKNVQASWKPKNNPNIPYQGPTIKDGFTKEQLEYFERFSKINYSILGDGLCRICD